MSELPLAIDRLRAAVNGDDFEWEVDGGSPFDDAKALLAAYDDALERLNFAHERIANKDIEISRLERALAERIAAAPKPQKRHTRDNPFDSDEFRQWADDMRARMIPKMKDSASVLMIAPRMEEKFDIEFALQIGSCILLEKPLILLVDRKRTIPPKLRAIADRIVEVDFDAMDSADVQNSIRQAMTDFAKQ